MQTSTCVVGLVENGVVYMGADCAGVSYPYVRLRKDPKLFRKDTMLIGFTSSFRMGQVLRYSLVLPKYDDRIDPLEYVSTSLINAIRSAFKDGGVAQKDKEVESCGDFLIGFKGRLFGIFSDYQVGECMENYDAVGCGRDYALGSLYSTVTEANAKIRVEKALEVAAYFSAGVRGPFVFETLL